MNVVVKLDDARFGAGPGTVVGFAESPEEFLRMTTDRDGARDMRYRSWRAYHGACIGDRVVAAQLGRSDS